VACILHATFFSFCDLSTFIALAKSTNNELLITQILQLLLGPNVLSTLPTIYYSSRVGDQVSHLYKTAGKIAALYMLMFAILGRKEENKTF
jgi:uncharacterized membrane protein